MDINWSLLQSGQNGFQNALALGVQAGTMARQARERREDQEAQAAMQSALGRAYANPDDREAVGLLFQRDPALAMRVGEYQDQQAFRSALGDYMGGDVQNALLGATGQQGIVASPEDLARQRELEAMFPDAPRYGAPTGSAPPVGNALATLSPDSSFQDAFAPFGPGGSQSVVEAPRQAPEARSGGVDLSALGQPQNSRDRAFLAMLQRDPMRALEIQSTLRDNFVDRAKAESEFYTVAIEELSRVGDDAGWQTALQRVAPIAQAMGADLSTIPQTYPGPEGVQRLLEGALPVKERLDFLLDKANTQADNDRADRNTDSMIENRQDRLAEYGRANRAREGNQRRGQDLSSADRRRGQDMTDSRVRSGRSSGGRSSRGSSQGLPTVRQGERTATGANGETLVVRNGQWVPARGR